MSKHPGLARWPLKTIRSAMAGEAYKPISWSTNDRAFKDKLNAMANNDQFLFENMPRAQYTYSGLTRTTGIKIAAGYIHLGSRGDAYAAATYHFGTYFSQGCRPVVVVGHAFSFPQRNIVVAVNGIGNRIPDHTGFEVYARTLTDKKITADVWLSFIAVGY
jgi:hypothetical protein